MKTIAAVWKNGQIVPTQPIDWPDGTSLRIQPIEDPHPEPAEDDLWNDDPGAIARRIAFYEALPPWRMSASEEAEWHAARREVKDYTLAKMREKTFEDQP